MKPFDTSLSLTPPSKMGVIERIGLTLAGIGLLSLLIAFVGASIPYWISMGVGLTLLVVAGILLSRDRERHKNTILILAISGIISIVMMILVNTHTIDLGHLVKSVQQEDGSWTEERNDIWYWNLFALIFGLISVGGIIYFYGAFGKGPAGIKNNGIKHSEATKAGGTIAWMLTIAFTGFYVMLYWFPDSLAGLSETVKPLQKMMTGTDVSWNSHWFLYGLIYSLAVLVMGIRFMFKYRHNRYQLIRTLSVAFFQLIIAFALPNFLSKLNYEENNEFESHATWQNYKSLADQYKPARDARDQKAGELAQARADGWENADQIQAQYDSLQGVATAKAEPMLVYQDSLDAIKPQVTSHYFSYFWPLDYDLLWPDQIEYYATGKTNMDEVVVPYESAMGFGEFGWWVILFGLGMSTIGVVVLTYFFGKRWYCSWVCGCGGLAETAGDPFRHLSDKSLKAWQIERITIHSVLVLVALVTAALLIDWQYPLLGEGLAGALKKGYGFVVGMTFAGVVGTGFYPILGSRVWCRFGCPQAAILGILQKYFSRFRITTNGGQCISCGNCSTYCEMGIDVKAYAQRGENIIRASCVGCGICSAVCPRGVLNLETGPVAGRYNGGGEMVADRERAIG